jgi:hypothetical protein
MPKDHEGEKLPLFEASRRHQEAESLREREDDGLTIGARLGLDQIARG